MNISGTVLKKLLKEERDTAIALVYDDLDLPLGTLKLSFGRGAGGHRGVQSVIDELGTKDFLRVRVGILPKTIFGTIKKPKGERAVEEFLLKPFGRREDHAFESIAKEADRALMLYMEHGKEKALSLFPQEKEA
jgi:PTH1 family peptidyl-tRNA hydrolase